MWRRWDAAEGAALAQERGGKGCGWLATHVDFHLLVEPVIQQQVVRHSDAVRLHRVALAVVVISCGHAGLLS